MSELDFYLVADEPNNDQNQSTYLKGTGEKEKFLTSYFISSTFYGRGLY